ncbi:MAG TPA: hypothetical protein VF960_15405 [Chloroflexota bacterium]
MTTALLLAWSVNFIVGLGLLALGIMMVRRPQRLWAGMKVPRDPEAAARVRRTNLTFGPVMLFLGLVDALSGLATMAMHMTPIGLAGAGLGILVAAIVVLILAALGSR